MVHAHFLEVSDSWLGQAVGCTKAEVQRQAAVAEGCNWVEAQRLVVEVADYTKVAARMQAAEAEDCNWVEVQTLAAGAVDCTKAEARRLLKGHHGRPQ